MTAVSFLIKKSYIILLNKGELFSFSTLQHSQQLHVQELSTFQYSYLLFSTLRFPFKPVCLVMPVTSQGISSPPIYFTSHTPFSWLQPFRLHRILDFFIRDFVSISTFSPQVVKNPGLPLTATSGSLLPYRLFELTCIASTYSRLQRAVSGIYSCVSFPPTQSQVERFRTLLLHSTPQNISQGKSLLSPTLLPSFRQLPN